MSLVENARNIISNQLFKRESIRSTVGTVTKKTKSYISLFNRDDNEDTIDYATGISILRDLQVATGFDILKYL